MAAITGLIGTARRVSFSLQYKGVDRIFSSSFPAPLASAISKSSEYLRRGEDEPKISDIGFRIMASNSGEGKIEMLWLNAILDNIDEMDVLKWKVANYTSALLVVLNPILAFLSQNSAGYNMMVVQKSNGLRVLSGVSLDNFQEGIDFRSYESRAVLRLMCFDADSRGASRLLNSGALIPSTCIIHPDTFVKWAGGLVDRFSAVLGGNPSGLFLGQVPAWEGNHEAMNQLIFLWSQDPDKDNASYAEFALDRKKIDAGDKSRQLARIMQKGRKKGIGHLEILKEFKAEDMRRKRNEWVFELLKKSAFNSGRLGVVLPTHYTSLPMDSNDCVKEIIWPKQSDNVLGLIKQGFLSLFR